MSELAILGGTPVRQTPYQSAVKRTPAFVRPPARVDPEPQLSILVRRPWQTRASRPVLPQVWKFRGSLAIPSGVGAEIGKKPYLDSSCLADGITATRGYRRFLTIPMTVGRHSCWPGNHGPFSMSSMGQRTVTPLPCKDICSPWPARRFL